MSADYRFVFDTNTVISALLFYRSVPRLALAMVRKQGSLLASTLSLNELKTTVQRRKFDKYVDEATRLEFYQVYAREAEIIVVTSTIQVCRDPKDNKFLELAVDGIATCIVSGDDDLLVLHPFQNISIITAREFLDTYTELEAE